MSIEEQMYYKGYTDGMQEEKFNERQRLSALKNRIVDGGMDRRAIIVAIEELIIGDKV